MEHESIPLPESAGFGVVVLAASAGGQAAILSILRDLPLDFDVPIVVAQHLHPESTVLEVYAGRAPYAFEWVDEQSSLAPRKVLVCPPRACMELLPDGSFHVEPCGGAIDKQITCLLQSVARSFSHRAIAVILTGMGNDGAAGAHELHRAGGRVLVQSESSAEYPEMPRAAIAAGAADLVVPLADIAQVLTDLVTGAVRPRARTELQALERVFGSQGEIAALARDIDWLRTPLGPALQWPLELRLSARAAIDSPHPTAVWWGPELVQIYNDAWCRFLGVSKHPQALGGPARETWHEVWRDIGPMVERVMREGRPAHGEDFPMLIDRYGDLEEVFVNFAYSAIRDAHGAVLGVHNTCWETTGQVVAGRRLAAMRDLAAHTSGVNTPREACEQAAKALAGDPQDLPFVLLYLFDRGRRQATLAGAAGLTPGSGPAPHTLPLADVHDTWALQRLLAGGLDAAAPGLLLEDLDRRVPRLAAWVAAPSGRRVPRSAFVVPLRWAEDKQPIGALIAGLNPHRPFDADYRSFVRLVAQQVSASCAQARARQLEREQRDRLAELDRAKTEFFANVSHEFRTPLTLLMSPLDELRRRSDELPPGLATEIDVAARNSRRLLRLVDSLLDFSQIEQLRQRAVLQPTDLAGLTTDVASVFRSAIERAGLEFRLACAPNLPLVPVDREMWEKVVSNLLSNALKFTFEGAISVRLHARRLHVELVVSDTGIGIPKQELPNLFKRFHRVRGARARTIEGSGIGLALVQDLVARMGGQLQVRSMEGSGTDFTVWVPLKSFRPTDAPVEGDAIGTRVARIATGLAEEAGGWLDDRRPLGTIEDPIGDPKGGPLRPAPGAHVLVADDNADLRDYLRRLLGAYWQVTVVADGAEALREARRQPPDLILADVMMPNVDGFALLRAVRDDDGLKNTPVVFLTARAGEDTAIEGLLAGADDYLAKPFSARELIARVGGQIELSRARRRTQELNAFLMQFTDRVRAIADPTEVARTACRMVHAHLGVDRAYWSEVDWTTREWFTVGEWRVPDVVPVSGRYPLDAWEPGTSWLLRGQDYVVDDIQQDPRLPATVKDACARLQLGASLASPVIVDGTLRSLLAVDHRAPHRWTADEVALVQGLASRCWPEMERARAEMALRASEEKYRTLFDSIDEGYALVELERDEDGTAKDLVWLEVNPAFERQSGAIGIVGKRASEFVPNTDRYFLSVNQAVADTGVPRRIETYNADLGRWFDAVHIRVGGEGSNLLGVVFSDITERKRAEAALRASEEKYRQLFERIDEGFCIIEVVFDGETPIDYRFLDVNPTFERHTGIVNAKGRSMREIAPDHEQHWFDRYGEVALTGRGQRFEATAKALGDRYYEVNAFRVGEPEDRRVAIVFSDITQRRKDIAALREAEERARRLNKAGEPAALDAPANRTPTNEVRREQTG
jgi:PAS domain S-box-containing protein